MSYKAPPRQSTGQEDGPGNEGTVPELASGGQTAPAQLTPTLTWPKHMRPQPSDMTKRPCCSSNRFLEP